jgi:hypothetical protein
MWEMQFMKFYSCSWFLKIKTFLAQKRSSPIVITSTRIDNHQLHHQYAKMKINRGPKPHLEHKATAQIKIFY